MPDISMCMGRACPDKEQCYRFMAEPNPFRQSYAAFHAMIAPGASRCDDFVPVDPKQEGLRHVPRT